MSTMPLIEARGLRAGTRKIRLVGRDSAGRKGSATVKVRVQAVTPQFLSVDAPSKVSRRARSVKLKVQSSVPAKLKVGRTKVRLGRRAKTVKVRVKPGKSRLALTLVLKAGGKSATSLLYVKR